MQRDCSKRSGSCTLPVLLDQGMSLASAARLLVMAAVAAILIGGGFAVVLMGVSPVAAQTVTDVESESGARDDAPNLWDESGLPDRR